MTPVVFYSWQSGSPPKGNRNLIEKSLKNAVKSLKKEANTFSPLRVDSDVKGTTGAVKIADEILAKIDCCSVFVADVTPLPKSTSTERITPNPNVMFELGYAAKAIGWDRVILVFNSAYGKMEKLPFDILGRRTLSYCAPENEKNLTPVRNTLQKELEGALRSILSNPFSHFGTVCFFNDALSLEITVHRPVGEDDTVTFEKHVVLFPIVLKGALRGTLTNIDCYLDFPKGLEPKDERGLKSAKKWTESKSTEILFEDMFPTKSTNPIGDAMREMCWKQKIQCSFARRKPEHASTETATLTVAGQQAHLHIKKLKATLVQELPELYVIIDPDTASFPAVIQYRVNTENGESVGQLTLKEAMK